MNELEFLQRQFGALDGQDGRLGLIGEKQEEIARLVNGRDARTLKGEEREQYRKLQDELKKLQSKREELASLIAEHGNLSSEQAVTELKGRLDTITAVHQEREKKNKRLKSEVKVKTSEGGVKYTKKSERTANVDLTLAVAGNLYRRNGRQPGVTVTANNPVSRVSGDALQATKMIIALDAVLNDSTATPEQKSLAQQLITKFSRVSDRYYSVDGTDRTPRSDPDRPDPQPDPVPDPTPDPVPDPQPDPVPDPTPDPVPDPQPDPVPDPQPDPVPDPQPDPVPDPQPDPVPDPQPNPTPDPNRQRIEVIDKNEIRARIYAYENGNTVENEAEIIRLRDEILEIQETYGVRDENGDLRTDENGNVILQEQQINEVMARRMQIQNAVANRGNVPSTQREQDVLPVLRELEQLPNVPGVEEETIYASEVYDRLQDYRNQLENLRAVNQARARMDQIRSRMFQIRAEANLLNDQNDPNSERRSQLDSERETLQQEFESLNQGPNREDDLTPEQERLIEIRNQMILNTRERDLLNDENDPDSVRRNELDNDNSRLQQEFDQLRQYDTRDADAAREEERLTNIIGELEDLYERRRTVERDVTRDQDGPDGRDDPDGPDGPGGRGDDPDGPGGPGGREDDPDGPDGPGGDDPHDPDDPNKPQDIDKKRQQKLDMMVKTSSEHIGTFDTYMHKFGQVPIFTKWNVLSSAAVAALGLGAVGLGAAGLTIGSVPIILGVSTAPILVTGATKIAGKLNDLIKGTNAKKKIMQDQINDLSDAEFDALVDGMDEKEMVSEKYEDIWLECVYSRLQKRNKAQIKEIRAGRNPDKIAFNDAKSRFEELSAIESRTPEEEQEYQDCAQKMNELYPIISVDGADAKKAQQLQTQLTDFRRGMRNKSFSMNNIRGRIMGVYNPDKREYYKEAQKLHQDILDAKTPEEEASARIKFMEFERNAVNEKRVGRHIFSRGKKTVSEVQILEGQTLGEYDANDQKPQFMQRAISLLMRCGGVLTLANQMNVAASVDQQNAANAATINQHNQDIAQHNADVATHNAEVVQHNATLAQQQQMIDTVKNACQNAPTEQSLDDAINLLIGDSFTQGHNGQFFLEQLGRFNESGADAALHQNLASFAAQYAQCTDYASKLNLWQQLNQYTQQQMQGFNLEQAVQAYASSHPQYNVDGLVQANDAILQSGNTAGVQVANTVRQAAKDLSSIQLDPITTTVGTVGKIGNVLVSIPSNMAAVIATNAAGILSHVRDALGIQPKNKEKEQEQQETQEQEEQEEKVVDVYTNDPTQPKQEKKNRDSMDEGR